MVRVDEVAKKFADGEVFLVLANCFEEGVEDFEVFEVFGVDFLKVMLAEVAVSDEVDDFFGGVGEGFLAEFDQGFGDWFGDRVFDEELEPEAALAVGLSG